MAEVTTPPEIYVDLCRVCGECYKSKKEKCNLFQGKHLWKPNYTIALEEICGPVRYEDDKPRSVCKHCCSTLNKYHTSVSETARIRRLIRVLKGQWEKVGESLIRGRYQRLPKILFSIPTVAKQMTKEVMAQLRKECQNLTSQKFNSVLRQNSPAALTDFRWEKVISEWQTTATTFLSFLSEASNANPGVVPGTTTTSTEQITKTCSMAMAGAVLLRSRCKHMSAAQRCNSLVMRRAGAHNRCLQRFSRLGICVGRTSSGHLTSPRTLARTRPSTTASSGQGDHTTSTRRGDDWSASLSVNRCPSPSQSVDLSEAETQRAREEEDQSKRGSEPSRPQHVEEASRGQVDKSEYEIIDQSQTDMLIDNQSDGKQEVNNADSGGGGANGIIPKILLANGRGGEMQNERTRCKSETVYETIQSVTPLSQSHDPTCDLSCVKSSRVLDSSAQKHRIQLSKKRKHRRPGKRTGGEMFKIPRVISSAVTSPPCSSSPPPRVYSSIFYSFPGSHEDDSLLKVSQGCEDSRPGGGSPRPLARIVNALKDKTKKKDK